MSLRPFLLPPSEPADLAAGFDRSARAGLAALGVIAALAPLSAPVAGALHPGRGLAVHAGIALLGIGALLLSRSRLAEGRSRLLGIAGTAAVVALLQVSTPAGVAPELPYVILITTCALPLRPLQALLLAVMSGAAAVAAGADVRTGLLAAALAPILLVISAVLYRGRTRAQERERELDHATARLELADLRWRGLVERLGDAMILVDDRTGLVEPLNTRLEEMLGMKPGASRGVHFTSLLHAEDLERVIEHHLARVAGKPVPERYRMRLVHADGRAVEVELTGRRSPDHRVTVITLRELPGTLAAAG
jgi:PAS domain S-box-containing protein